jgi:hypothetical protein
MIELSELRQQELTMYLINLRQREELSGKMRMSMYRQFRNLLEEEQFIEIWTRKCHVAHEEERPIFWVPPQLSPLQWTPRMEMWCTDAGSVITQCVSSTAIVTRRSGQP